MIRHDRLRWYGYAPAEALPGATAAVLAAVLILWHRQPTVTYGDLEAATGWRRSSIQPRLAELRRLGLVTWEDGLTGTLRPLVTPRPVGCALASPR